MEVVLMSNTSLKKCYSCKKNFNKSRVKYIVLRVKEGPGSFKVFYFCSKVCFTGSFKLNK